VTTEWQYNAGQNSGKLKISGALTILHVAALKAALLEAFAQADRVDVDLAAITEVDVAGLQLLCAGQSFARGRSQQLLLTLADNRLVLDLIGDAGLTHELFDGGGQTAA